MSDIIKKALIIGLTASSLYLISKNNNLNTDTIAFATGFGTFTITKILESKPSNFGKLLLII
ncbi:hypothetical protein CPAV1605_991 [seawater metagenome]|uniref:Uncharacterized protein n=1 Tax=seawater metagenome TaxID=1561972 RepID=A0A5E8CJC0_9ZZZZ